MNDTPPAAADATVDTLLTAYLRALDETHDVPAFSPWRYAALFGDLVRWEVAFLALVFVAPLLKLIRLCLRRFGADVPRGTPSLGWQEVKRPFQAIWRGDISALQVVRMRVLTRTFIGSHIVGVVEELKLVAERARLDALMGGPARADDLGPLETELRKLESLGTVAKAQNSLGAVLATGSASALPLALAKLLIPAILQLLPGDVADQIGAFVPLGQVLKTIGLADDESISLTPVLLAVGGGFLTFLLITVMSCHIEKRRILAGRGRLRPGRRAVAVAAHRHLRAAAGCGIRRRCGGGRLPDGLFLFQPDAGGARPVRPDADRDRRPRTVPGDCDHCCSPAVVSAQATGRSIGRLGMVAGQARPAARHRPRPLTSATQAGA